MPEPTLIKAALRRELLANRHAISTEVRQDWNAAICRQVVAWWETCRAPTLGVFSPIRGEPDLQVAYAELVSRNVCLALPVVVDKDAPLAFIAWKPGDAMTRDAFGVSIPASGAALKPEALLVPCVGFNEKRFRLGYGGGFYDRTLAASPRPMTIGIAYACGRAQFEADPHDIPLDMVITEARCF